MISPLPGATTLKPGSAHVPAARHRAPRSSTRPATASSAAAATSRSPARGRRCCGASTATPSATRRRTGRRYRGPLLRRRRLQARRRRLPLAARPGRRRDERLRPPHLDHRGRVGALVDHPAVAEAAVVGANDATTGQAIIGLRHPAGRQRPERRARRGGAPARGQEARRHRPTEDGHLHRRAAQDPLRQDHAAPAARRRRGPRRSATPRRWPTRTSSRRSSAGPPRPRRRTDDPTPPSTGAGGTARSSRARPSSSTSTACCPTRPAASTSSSARAADWDAFFEACGEDALDRRGRPAPRPPRPRPADRPAHRPARSGSSATPSAGSSATPLRWDLLVMREWGDYRRLTRLQAGRRPRAAALRLRPAPRVRRRPPQRRHVPPRRRPLHLHPLAATTSDGRPRFSRGSSGTGGGCRSRAP